MAKPRKKVSNPPKDVSSSNIEIEVNQFAKAPLFNGNFDIWVARMRNFLKTQGIEVWKSVITNDTMDEESKEYNTRAMKAILNGLPNSMKANFEKCSSAKVIWDKLHDLHSKGALTMISSQEDDGKQERSPEFIKEAEDKRDDNKAKEDLEDEENKEDFEEDLLNKLMASMEEINSLKKENEELKKKAQDGNQDKTRKEVDFVKLQVQERDEELAKLKEEFHQNKRKHHEEVISMTNQLDKAKKREETLSSHLEQRLKSLNNLEAEIGQYKEEVSSLRSQLEEARKQAQGAEKVMETLAFIEGQVDEAEKERNTMICQLDEKDEEILKLKSDINLLKAETCEATRIKEEMESSLAKENEEVFIMKSNIISLKIEAHEATRMMEEMKKQLLMKDEDCEKLKGEIVFLKKEVDLLNKNLKSSQTLDEILSHQRYPLDK